MTSDPTPPSPPSDATAPDLSRSRTAPEDGPISPVPDTAPAPATAADPAPIGRDIADDGPQRGGLQTILQTIGAIAGLALFAWAISIVLGPENRPRLEKMAQAPLWAIITLAVLTAGSIALNAMVFWFTIRAWRKLRATDLIAVNVISTFTAILPFKIGLLVRMFIHRRRDGIGWTTMAGWFAATAALALAVLVPVGAVGAWRGKIDVLWVLGVALGPAVCTGAGLIAARVVPRIGVPAKLMLGADKALGNLRIAAGAMLVRMGDVAVQCARFWVGAMVVGSPIGAEQAALLGSTYFLIKVVAPVSLGFVEMGTAGMAGLIGVDPQLIALVAVAITATETLVAAVFVGPAAAWLRLHRLFGASYRPPATL